MKLATPAILLLADQASASVLSCDITHKTSLLAPIDKEVKYINNEQEFFIDGSSGLAMDRQIFKPLTTTNKAKPNACCGTFPYDDNIKGCCTTQSDRMIYNKATQDCCADRTSGISEVINTESSGCCANTIYDVVAEDCCVDETTGDESIHDAAVFPGCRCEFGEWGEWSKCEDNFGGGFRDRTREFLPKIENLGKTCPSIGKKEVKYIIDTEENIRDANGQKTDSCINQSANFLFQNKGFNSSSYYKDLIILLDESTSIKKHNFEYAKNLVKNIVKSLCGGIGPNRNRVSVIRYSSSVKLDIRLSDVISTEEVLEKVDNFAYRPILNERASGTTWTAQAMNYVYEELVTKPDSGWRNGDGPKVCSGVILNNACYFISEKKAENFEQINEVCQEAVKGEENNADAESVTIGALNANEFEILQRMVSDIQNNEDLPYVGMRFDNINRNWMYSNGSIALAENDENNSQVQQPFLSDFFTTLVKNNQIDLNCVAFQFNSNLPNIRQNYKFALTNCLQPRKVLCRKVPLNSLKVSTELLLITDGRSNDPKQLLKYGLKEMKSRFADINVDMAAIGVGTRINQNEIRSLTDNRPGQILYLMSWSSVNSFNNILTKIINEGGYEADTCLPLEVDVNDLVWQKWFDIMVEEGIDVSKLNSYGMSKNKKKNRQNQLGRMVGSATPVVEIGPDGVPVLRPPVASSQPSGGVLSGYVEPEVVNLWTYSKNQEPSANSPLSNLLSNSLGSGLSSFPRRPSSGLSASPRGLPLPSFPGGLPLPPSRTAGSQVSFGSPLSLSQDLEEDEDDYDEDDWLYQIMMEKNNQ